MLHCHIRFWGLQLIQKRLASPVTVAALLHLLIGFEIPDCLQYHASGQNATETLSTGLSETCVVPGMVAILWQHQLQGDFPD